MENLNIGRSGIEVPFLGMGTWAIGGGAWWGDNDDALSVKAIQTAVEQGIQWIDTAPIYGLYHSETVVGEAMKHIDRDKVVLSTKCGLEWRHETPVLHKVVDGTAVYRDLSAQSIIEDVEDSLRRLGTDHLDVLYTHWQSPDLGLYPLEETVEAMMKLKEQGKIRAIGASNVTADLIRGYCRYGQLDVIQEKYSLLTRRIEKQLLPTCKELGVSVQAYSPLEQGLLTGKVTMDTTYPEGSTRNTNPCFQPARRMQAIRLLDSWSDLCEKYHCTKAQLVIALTARSGRAALVHRLELLGYDLTQEELDATYAKFLELADKKKEIHDYDLLYLVGDIDRMKQQSVSLKFLQVTTGTLVPTATVVLKFGDHERMAIATGNGPVDAAVSAIKTLINEKVVLMEFLMQAITRGSNDVGRVHVQVQCGSRTVHGFAAHTDTTRASIEAFLDALRVLNVTERKEKEE